VVLGGEDDVPVGPIDRLPEAGDVVARVVPQRPGRCTTVEEGQGVIAQVDQLDLEVVPSGQVIDDPPGHVLAEPPLAGGSGDDLDEHGATAPGGRRRGERAAARMPGGGVDPTNSLTG